MSESAVITAPERLDRDAAAGFTEVLAAATAADGAPPRLVVDLGTVQHFDTAGMAALVAGIRDARRRGVDLQLGRLPPEATEFFSLVSVGRLLEPPLRRGRRHLVVAVGAAVEPLCHAARDVVSLAGRCFAACLWPRRGQGVRWDRTVLELDAAAVGALPIVLLIALLLGLVLAMQAFVQLRVWGAEIYVADMVGVSVVSEIGPLMTAVVLAARSGGSNAAQLGAMVISEEITALRQMAVDPLRFAVVPKIVALAIAAGVLALAFDAAAIAGGALFAVAVGAAEVGAYLEQTRTAVGLDDFLIGLFKAVVFGITIGVVGCALGLRVVGGSTGVARATTHAVVTAIFLVIVLDSLCVTGQRWLLG